MLHAVKKCLWKSCKERVTLLVPDTLAQIHSYRALSLGHDIFFAFQLPADLQQLLAAEQATL